MGKRNSKKKIRQITYLWTGALQKNLLTWVVLPKSEQTTRITHSRKVHSIVCAQGLHPSSNSQQTWSQMLACNSQNLCSSALPVALWVMGPHLLSKCSIWKVLGLSSPPPCPSHLIANCSLHSLYSQLTFELQEHQWHGAQRWQSSAKKMKGVTAMSCRAKKGEYNLYPAEWPGLNYKCTRAS